MTEAIIVALITGAASVLGQIIISRRGSRDRLVREAKKEQELNDKLTSIERKLTEHNRYAEKIGAVQTDLAVIRTEITHLKSERN